jgi:sulfoxide reductase heme-binding subunit YedZ
MNHEFWYLSRAAGFTAYLLLFASMALGMMITARVGTGGRRQNLVFDMHRFVSVLALLATGFHTYVLLGDQYLNFNVWQLSLPFLSPYRGVAVAIGVLSTYALVLVVASFWMRQHMGFRAWRMIHVLSFVLYAGATAHGIAAGTDTSQLWAGAMYFSTSLILLVLLVYRVDYAMRQRDEARRREVVKTASKIRRLAA